MTIGTYVFSQRVYPNKFEWSKIGLVLMAAMLLWWVSTEVLASVLWQGVSVVAFVCILTILFWHDLRAFARRRWAAQAVLESQSETK
jgi:membrane protein YdbS with pleckstrin-like domain